MRQALYSYKLDNGKIRCGLCPHHCVIAEGRRGLCGVRGVSGGGLMAFGYGHVSSAHLDPIEKKPLYHFHPGTEIFSVGGWGCNFACTFCQNWSISQQVNLQSSVYQPEELVAAGGSGGSIGIAYTYNEPLINIEYVLDCARLAREAGLVNVLVTNGYVEEQPASDLLPWIDALNVDIKSMDDAFYRTLCRGSLEPVLRFCRQAVAKGCHVEITNLLIPGENDSEPQVAKLACWIREHLGEKTPLHLSAYHPDYKLDRPATPVAVLKRAWTICRKELPYVYMGNVMSEDGQHTHCPACGAVQISRQGYHTVVSGLKGNACAKCGRPADIVLPQGK